MTLIQHRRSKTSGSVPTSVADGELVLNQADGILFSADASGNVVSTPLKGMAPLASPNFTGSPTAPKLTLAGGYGNGITINGLSGSITQLYDDGNGHLEANGNLWVQGNSTGSLILAYGGGQTFIGKAGVLVNIVGTLNCQGAASFLVTPTAPTATIYDNSTKLATTAYADRAASLVQPDGCCRLSVASPTSLVLNPFNGQTLWINGQACAIPSAGVTLAAPSVTASTLYYVYATASAFQVNALVLSTTGHITGADGREYLSSGGGSPTAVTTSRFVGMVYTYTDAKFYDNGTSFRGCLNWFNRRSLAIINPTQGGTSSTSYVPVGNICYGLTWGDEATQVRTTGFAYNSSANYAEETTNGVDGNLYGSVSINFATVSVAQGAVSVEYTASMTEGIHTFCSFGAVTGGSGTWNAMLSVIIRG